MMLDKDGIEYSVHSGHEYYNRTHAARYVGMTDTGFRRKIERVKKEQNIVVPLLTLPSSMQNKYIDKRILDIFKKSIVIGKEQEWYDELRKVIEEVV